ncbi:chalcone isomerase-like protein [Roseibium hamelinense]|uniref:Chalcone isomerase-like protein n=1 Tax=Roseibium hamelinense TaxID=150831 RepID=A0A562SXU9_9HYPH|nr:chalcone isomerase family protein [Roseibium hamelinense]MTI43670.1 hypothetical protein [Roseibium hamelinense]TWI86187.1 chalcone isomerase-like protein [Roseibium hamelinense]
MKNAHGSAKRIFLKLTTAAFISLAAAAPLPAYADLGAAARSVPSAKLVGEGKLTFLGFSVFEAELYAPGGSYSATGPFALKLTYLRNFKGEAIAERSAKEMVRQGVPQGAKLDRWTEQMRAIFPNISRGQSITGVRTNSGNTDFYLGNQKIGSIQDKEFTRRFFAIWLGPNTNDPALRAKLVGANS